MHKAIKAVADTFATLVLSIGTTVDVGHDRRVRGGVATPA